MRTDKQQLADCLLRQLKVKDEIAFLRLQIKQEAKQTRWAKGSPIIKQFKAQWPDLTIENGAGMTYLGLKLGMLDDYVEHLPAGWEVHEVRTVGTGLGDPVLTVYRMRGVPALLYVTKAVR